MNEMNENTLVLIVVIGLVIGFAYKIFYEIAGKRLPKKSFVGFSSIKDIAYYYKLALSIISEKSWLIWLPLGFALSNFVIRIPILIMQRSAALKSIENSNLQDLFYNEPFFEQIFKSLFQASKMLSYGYDGAISGSYLFLLLATVCAILLMFKNKSNKLQQYIEDNNIESFIFLKQILKYYLIGLLCFIFLGIFCEFVPDEESKLPCFMLISPVANIWALLGLSLLSIIEGFILFTVKGLIEGSYLDKEKIFNDTLAILKPLFYVNIVLVIIYYLSAFVMYPYTIQSYFNIVIPDIMVTVSSVLKYSNSLIVILTVCVPFVLVNEGGTFKSAFLLNFKFIGDNLFKYFQFICTAILLIFFPSLLKVLISFLANLYSSKLIFNALSIYSLLLDIIVTTLQILIAVPIYIALFIFFRDWRDTVPCHSSGDLHFLHSQKTGTL